MSDIAFTVHGFGVTVAQRDAGLAAMVDDFRAGDVRRALAYAGVDDLPGKTGTIDRAADRLMQAERRRGAIVAVTNKLWRQVASQEGGR